jgi:nicotinamide mononucleotide adenylyltransferase
MSAYFNNSEHFQAKGIKYILSIGRRQPMHLGHKLGLEKILNLQGIKLIYVIGSTNLKGDPLFNPFVNPLTLDQQIEQFKRVFPGKEAIFLPILDVADMSKWGPSIEGALKELSIEPEDCAIYFIGKEEDRLKKAESFFLPNGEEVTLAVGQWLIESLCYYKFSMWVDRDLPIDLTLSARNLRELDLGNLTSQQKKLIAAPEYLYDLAVRARENNPDKELLKNKPITMEDLSLERIRNCV